MAVGRTVAGDIVRRIAPVPAPLKRGAAVVAVTGGVLTVAGVAATIPVQVDPHIVAAASVLPAETTAPDAADAADSGSAADIARVPVSTAPAAAEQLDTAKLVKAVQLAERETTRSTDVPEEQDGDERDNGEQDTSTAKSTAGDAKADKPAKSSSSGSTSCGLNTSQLGPVKTHVRAAANFLGCQFGKPTVLGVAGRAGNSDHPSGKALDFVVDRGTGNALADCALHNQEALGISYVIWRQRINFGSGWKPMEDRGSPTANHMDHVHVSFESGAGGRRQTC